MIDRRCCLNGICLDLEFYVYSGPPNVSVAVMKGAAQPHCTSINHIIQSTGSVREPSVGC